MSGGLEPLAFSMVDADDEIERSLERPIIDGGYESVANHEMVEPGRLASRKFDRFTHQESSGFLPDRVPFDLCRRRNVRPPHSRAAGSAPEGLSSILGSRIDAIESLIGMGPSQIARLPDWRLLQLRARSAPLVRHQGNRRAVAVIYAIRQTRLRRRNS